MQTAFYDDLKQRFLALLTEHGLLQEKVSLHTKMLTPEEAIGIPKLSLIHISSLPDMPWFRSHLDFLLMHEVSFLQIL